MAETKLNLKAGTNVQNLKTAHFTTDDGHKMLAIAVGTDTVHIVSADGSLEGFGGITVTGPGVTTVALSFSAIVEFAIKTYEAVKGFFGGGGGGGGKKTCTTSTTVHTDAGGSTTTTTTTCTAT
jgi:hypothetical protein